MQNKVQCSPLINNAMYGSIIECTALDLCESCYKGTILQRNLDHFKKELKENDHSMVIFL